MTTGLAGLAARGLAATAHFWACVECGAEPRVAGLRLACALHPGAALVEFAGGRRRLREREMMIASTTREGVAYRVLIGLDGKGVCTCQGSGPASTCRHAREAEEVWMTNVDAQPVTALVPIRVDPPSGLLPSKGDLEIIGMLARTAMGAHSLLPAAIKTVSDAAVVMIAGLELGVRPMTSLRHIFIVNGKPEPDAQIMAGIVQAKEPGALLEVVELTDARCTMRIRRPARDLVAEYTYEIEDARKAQLIKPGNPWDKFPKDMLRWAATKRLCRAYAPDLINAVGVTLSDVPEMGSPEEIDYAPIDVTVLPASALYSEGDEPAPVTARVVDEATGEIIEDDRGRAEPALPDDAPPPSDEPFVPEKPGPRRRGESADGRMI